MLVTKQLTVAIDCHAMEIIGCRLITSIIQNIIPGLETMLL